MNKYEINDRFIGTISYNVITTKGTTPSETKTDSQESQKEVTTMTNITMNAKNRTIELTKKDYDKACKFGTQEYFDLQEARKAYPTYKVVKVTHKAPKSTFKGLTYSYMEKYILAHDDADKSIMKEYLLLRGETDEADEALAEPANYQEMKDWFLEKFPAVANFHKNRAELIEKSQQKKEAQKKAAEEAKKLARRNALITKKTA